MLDVYKEQVGLLLHILPLIYKEKNFAVHGGTAINLFVQNMPRYSVDVDITYVPIEDRETSLKKINEKLHAISDAIKQAVPGVKIKAVPEKLLCMRSTYTVKIEVNAIQRGLIGDCIEMPLCEKAQQEFELFCKARLVSISQLYGGKIGAALARQHPRDLFDFKYMNVTQLEKVKQGLIYNILSSQKPIVELLSPHPIDQKNALENQFAGMTNVPFNYEDYEQTRQKLVAFVNSGLNDEDKKFLIAYENGEPLWNTSPYRFQHFPSIQWKQVNIHKLKAYNPAKHRLTVDKLQARLYPNVE